MSDTIKGSCGFDAAKFAIGPALDEIEMAKPKSGVKSSYTTLISLLDPEDQFPKNNFTSNYTEQSDSFVQILDFSKSFAPSIIPKFSHFLCVFSALLLLLISLR